jgi:hypothetical protein
MKGVATDWVQPVAVLTIAHAMSEASGSREIFPIERTVRICRWLSG